MNRKVFKEKFINIFIILSKPKILKRSPDLQMGQKLDPNTMREVLRGRTLRKLSTQGVVPTPSRCRIVSLHSRINRHASCLVNRDDTCDEPMNDAQNYTPTNKSKDATKRGVDVRHSERHLLLNIMFHLHLGYFII